MMKLSRLRQSLATTTALLFAALGAAALQLPAASAEDVGSGLVVYHDAELPAKDVTLLKGEAKVMHEIANELVERNMDDLAYTYVNAESRLVVVVATNRGEELVRQAFGAQAEAVIIERGNYSLGAILDLGSQLLDASPNASQRIAASAIDPSGSALNVAAHEAIDEVSRAEIESFAVRNALPINVYLDTRLAPIELLDRLEDTTPFAGGFRSKARTSTSSTSGSTRGPCTGGFGWKRDGKEMMLTAGHCYPVATTYTRMWNTFSNGNHRNWIGDAWATSLDKDVGSVPVGQDNDEHGDIALVNLTAAGKAAGNQIWWGPQATTTKIPVTHRELVDEGDPVCFSGSTSGADCGTDVAYTNISVTLAHDTGSTDDVYPVHISTSTNAADCAAGGDSGAPVVFNHAGEETAAAAMGVVAGGGYSQGLCELVFTGLGHVIAAWGGSLQTQ